MNNILSITLLAAILALIVGVFITVQEQHDACERMGGVLLQSVNEYICASNLTIVEVK